MENTEKRSLKSWLNCKMTKDELFKIVASYMRGNMWKLRPIFEKELKEVGANKLSDLSHEQLKTYWDSIKPQK